MTATTSRSTSQRRQLRGSRWTGSRAGATSRRRGAPGETQVVGSTSCRSRYPWPASVRYSGACQQGEDIGSPDRDVVNPGRSRWIECIRLGRRPSTLARCRCTLPWSSIPGRGCVTAGRRSARRGPHRPARDRPGPSRGRAALGETDEASRRNEVGAAIRYNFVPPPARPARYGLPDSRPILATVSRKAKTMPGAGWRSGARLPPDAARFSCPVGQRTLSPGPEYVLPDDQSVDPDDAGTHRLLRPVWMPSVLY